MMEAVDDYQKDGYMKTYGAKRDYYEQFPREVDLRGYRRVLREIAGRGRILDYGCGRGSLGYLGDGDGRMICGLDFPANERAVYHDREEVAGHFNTIVFSHVLEHFGRDAPTQRAELKEALTWAKTITGRLVIGLPNNLNAFMRLRYQDDWTHNPVSPDNNDFLSFVEGLGWRLVRIIRCDAQLNLDPRLWARFFFNLATMMDPTYNVIYVFEQEAARDR